MVNYFHVIIDGKTYTRSSENHVYTHVIVVDHLSQKPYWSAFQEKLVYPSSYELAKSGAIPRWGVWGWAGSFSLAEKAAARARKVYPVVGIHDAILGKPHKVVS